MIKITALLAVILLTTVSPVTAADSFKKIIADDKSSYAHKVLFIGNSILFVGETPEAYADVSKSMEPNKQLKITEVAGPGFKLQDHIRTGMALDAIKNEGSWDYVIIQPQSNEFTSRVSDSTLQSLNTLVQAAKQVKATPLLYEWFACETTNDYKIAHQNVVNTASRLGIGTLPVRTTIAYLLQQNPRFAYQEDGTHFNDTGVYVAVAVLYAKLTGKNPNNLPTKVRLASGNSLDVQYVDARAIQNIAAQVVKTFK